MEIAIRLPADYPLHGVEIKDIRRVGVTEAKWRAWLLAVQQVMTSRDGMVLDALTLFKRNVSLHFEGVVDCAIVSSPHPQYLVSSCRGWAGSKRRSMA
jgi:hypothetical protein